jgi:serine/threonine protein kinase
MELVPEGLGQWAMLRLVAQAAAQPVRILVGFAQVVGNLGDVLHVEYPPMLARAIALLRPLLTDGWGLLFQLDCVAALRGAFARFALYALALPLALLAAIALRFLCRRRRDATAAWAQLRADAFLVSFVCYPTVCKHAFGIFNCRALSQTLVVLQSDYATECGTPAHTAASVVAGLVIIFVAVGIPLGFTASLVRRARAFDADKDAAEIGGTFAARMGISPREAADVIREVELGKDYGFLLRAYGPRYYWFENFDMVRKLLLVGVLVLVERGSIAQIACAACLSVSFIMMHFKLWPYKLSADSVFKALVEVQIFATVLAALVLKEDLSGEVAGKGFYDLVLITLFIANVPTAFAYTVVAKVQYARKLLSEMQRTDEFQLSRTEVAMQALARHQAGLGSTEDVQILRSYFSGLRAYAGRYRLHKVAPKYVSPTSTVCAATDIQEAREVAVKIMRNEDDWWRELAARGLSGGAGDNERLDPRYVVPVVAWQEVDRDGRMKRERHLRASFGARADSRPEGEWLIAMPLADRNLHDVIAAELPAGRPLAAVVADVIGIARCLHHLHARGMVHLDIRPRNICRFPDGWKLADLDAAADAGQLVGRPGKWSGAFMAPELARLALLRAPAAGLRAEAAMDVWAFGALLFELLSGRQLLASERTKDGLVGVGAQLELLNWRRIDKDRLALVLAENTAVSTLQQRNAQDLVSWCLNARPEERPSMAEVLEHAFLSPERALEPLGPELRGDGRASLAHWHFFLSHMQTEATDLVRTLCLLMERNGCRAWLDMQADDITLSGMRAGVRSSDVLLLVLTKGVLFRFYCIAEIFEAITAQKRIVLVSEEDPRLPDRWDFPAWERDWGAGDGSDYAWCRQQLTDQLGMAAPEAQRAMDAVGELVRRRREEVIPYRRRQFETEAMLAELFRRCDLYTAGGFHAAGHAMRRGGAAEDSPAPTRRTWSSTHAVPAAADARPAEQLVRQGTRGKRDHVAVIWTASGARIKEQLVAALAAENLDAADARVDGIGTASRVLLVLTAGAMADPVVVAAVAEGMRARHAIVVVQDSTERAGEEAKRAPPNIRKIFAQHEFMECVAAPALAPPLYVR